ncbi:MAG: GNAT family N-acetyltransferase [Acidobacteriota bacterium]|nr:GNAT family N-acetyltransferase [Acidobacteriota bacterium]
MTIGRAASGTLRVLDQHDIAEFEQLLRRDPLTNLFVASRVAHLGLAPEQLGCAVYGYHVGGELVAACHVGANLVPIGDDRDAIDAFAEAIGPRRRVWSIMGSAQAVRQLHQGLVARWGDSWARTRDVRAHQPLMVTDTDPGIEGDPAIQRIGLADYEPYLDAAIAMYTEEVGVTPLDGSGSYQRYVRMLIQMGHAMGALQRVRGQASRVWFKSDIGSAWSGCCQVQGVWISPELRGRRLSIPAMAQVVRLCRQRYPVVSLYVNDYNTRARRLYQGLGFRTVGELATVLY